MQPVESSPTAGARPASGDVRRAAVLAALSLWAMAVPWTARALGLRLDVPTRLEVIDHVVPGLVVLACCALLLHPRTAKPSDVLRLIAVAVACLAGFWITATHATLLPEAIEGVTPWGPALLHLSAGPPITASTLWMLLLDAGR